GRIVLYSREDGVIDAAGEILRTPERIDRLALANPKTAPYGAAAIQTMTALGVLDGLRPRFVRGDSIAQTFQFVVTGNAPVGFVAVAQVQDREGGSRWMVPPELYDPIVQDAVLLKTGADNPAAQAFHRFLQSDAAREIIARNGYGLDDQEP
ncbi:MAG: molybdate ABC transporter substrate-binding protein, partial [Rhodospirillaceae bacterium]